MRSHSFFLKLFASFALLVIVPVVALYGYSSRQLVADSEQAIGASCVQSLRIADTGVRQLEASLFKDAVGISRDFSIGAMIDYLGRDGNFTGPEMVDISRALSTVINAAQNDENYHSVYLSLDRFAFVFSSDHGLKRRSEFADTGWRKAYEDYKTQSARLPIFFSRRIDSEATVSGAPGAPTYVVTYVYPLTPYTTALDGAVVINVKLSAVENLLNGNRVSTDGALLILDGHGAVVSALDRSTVGTDLSAAPHVARVLSSEAPSGYFAAQVGGVDTLVSYYRSDFNGWTYVGLYPIRTLMDSSDAIGRNLVLLTLAILLLGLLAALAVSNRIYSPLRTLVKSILRRDPGPLRPGVDELAIIREALDAANTRIYSQELDKRRVQESSVLRILADGSPDEADRAVLAEILPRSGFLCAVVSLDRTGGDADCAADRTRSDVKALLEPLSGRLLGDRIPFLLCSMRLGEVVVLCNVDASCREESRERLRDRFAELQRELVGRIEGTLTVGIGSCYGDVSGIRDSYVEAAQAVRQRLRLGAGKVVLYDPEFSASAYYYPFELEEQIRNTLDLEMKEETLAKIRELVQDLKTRRRLSCENVTLILSQLVGNTLVRFLVERRIPFEEVFEDLGDADLFAVLFRQETLDGMETVLVERYAQVVDYAKMARNRKNNVERILDYLAANYRRDIGILDVSEHVGLSYSHVRRIFKLETGANIVDYLNSMRVREAKELLLDRTKSVKTIAAALGYNNSQSFERYFRKYVGVTPGDYRTRKGTPDGATT